jgi:HK97 family phage portal protein
VTSLLGRVLGPRNSVPAPYIPRRGYGVVNGHAEGKPIGAMSEISALFPIVSTGANAVSQIEWKLYRRATNGLEADRVELDSSKHLAAKVWNRWNPFFHRQLGVESAQQHLELLGECILVCSRSPLMPSLGPLEMWPVRPDRMTPVPDRETYLRGWIYTSPDGEKVPLETQDVLQIRMPNPEDPYRGLGPVQAMLMDLDSAKYSAAWNRNFFKNDATPGGVIEFPENYTMSDAEWREFTDRWREQHQGVSNAGRVAILEAGAKWVDRGLSMRDMQFTELRQLSNEMIRKAFGFPKHLLGDSEDVNRANAEAQDAMFGTWFLKPRAERWKHMLNFQFLPMFGTFADGLEFDYENPVPEDREAEGKSLQIRTTALALLAEKGFDTSELCELLDFPELSYTRPEPSAPAVAPGQKAAPAVENTAPAGKAAAVTLPWATHVHAHHAHVLARPQSAAPGPPPEVDLADVQAAWEAARERLAAAWASITDSQREDLVRQVREVVDSGDVAQLASLTTDSAAGAELLAEFMRELAQVAGSQVAAEAAVAGVYLAAQVPEEGVIAETAAITAAILAAELALSAGREALRVRFPGATGREVSDAVANHLRNLSGAFEAKHLGAALTGAQNGARIATFAKGPIAALYANETLDKSTCGPCRTVNGRWLGNSDNGTDMEQVNKTYPLAGYIDCEGGVNCRGTVTGVWRSQTLGG